MDGSRVWPWLVGIGVAAGLGIVLRRMMERGDASKPPEAGRGKRSAASQGDGSAAENWDSYIARVNDELASLFVNLARRSHAPDPSLPTLLWAHLKMRSPRPDGLVRSNPGSHGEQIAAALATDTGTIRPVMKKLIAAGKVTTEGQRRGMTYEAR